MPLGTPGPLDDYMQTYGERLKSMLPATAPSTSQLGGPAASPDGPAGEPPVSSPDGPNSFQTLFKKMPEEHQDKQVEDFEQTLKKGGSDIDSAYDEMTQKLGQRPDGSLSRKDKGMLLLEFGLNMMRNSSGKAYGNDIGGAAGDAGLRTLAGYQSRLEGKQKEYDENRSAIDAARTRDKVDLLKQNALESSRDQRYEARDKRRLERENSQLSRTVTDPENNVYGVTRGGKVSRLDTPAGSQLRARPPAARGGARPLESEAMYRRYLQINGTDAKGKPLKGDALRKVQNEALEFAKGKHSPTNESQWVNIFRDAIRRGYEPPEARKTADDAVGPFPVKNDPLGIRPKKP